MCLGINKALRFISHLSFDSAINLRKNLYFAHHKAIDYSLINSLGRFWDHHKQHLKHKLILKGTRTWTIYILCIKRNRTVRNYFHVHRETSSCYSGVLCGRAGNRWGMVGRSQWQGGELVPWGNLPFRYSLYWWLAERSSAS